MNNIFTPFPILESDRLMLKPLTASDRLPLFKYQSNKANFEFVNMTIYKNISEVDVYMSKMNKGVLENKWIIWGIHTKENGLIGTISIWNLNHETATAEFGYGIFPEYRQRGYMLEALTLCVQYGFDQMKLRTLEAYTNIYNQPSRRFLEKFGFDYVKDIDEDGEVLAIYHIKNKLSH